MSAIYVNNNIDSFSMLVRKNVYSFKTHLGAISNLLVQNLVCFIIILAVVLGGRKYSIYNLLCVLYTSPYHNSYVYGILYSKIN